MALMLTTADASEQFSKFDSVCQSAEVVFVDQPFGTRATKSSVEIRQNAKTIFCAPGENVLFFPFRGPFDVAGAGLAPLSYAENLLFLIDCLDTIEVNFVNSPVKWNQAYSKTALLRVANAFPGLVPQTEIVDCSGTVDVGASEQARIIKSGYGVKRMLGGLHPYATWIPPGKPILLNEMEYRFAIQDYWQPEMELRAYTISIPRVETVCLEMPIGNRSNPDWRDTLIGDKLVVKQVYDDNIGQWCDRLIRFLGVNYCCFDFLYTAGEVKLVDINPHGSWFWLPSGPRNVVDDFFQRLLMQAIWKAN